MFKKNQTNKKTAKLTSVTLLPKLLPLYMPVVLLSVSTSGPANEIRPVATETRLQAPHHFQVTSLAFQNVPWRL